MKSLYAWMIVLFSALAAAAAPLASESQLMARAFPAAGALAAGTHDVQVIEARKLAQKALGDDVRDLVFVPVAPCTVWDTRFATEPQSAGAITNGTTKRFFSHLDGAGGSFATWGGNPTCPEASENFIGGRPFAVMMTVYISDATVNGWLTLYRDGDADPSLATISVYYSPGPTRTQTVIAKSSRGYGTGAFDVAATSRFGSVNASASVTGYFIKPVNIVLPPSTATTGNILKGANRFIHNAGAFNTSVGESAGSLAATGTQNTALGTNALTSLTTGASNTAVGAFALFGNQGGHGNTALGTAALGVNDFGTFNTALGTNTLQNNTSGEYNLAAGVSALGNNMTGDRNTALGGSTLNSNTIGADNTAAGYVALSANTTGVSNTAVGFAALLNNTTGTANVALGQYAGANRTTGNFNIDIGNVGMATESATIRIGQPLSQTRAFIAGIRGVTTDTADAIPVLVDSNGQLGTISSSARVKDDIADMGEESTALMKLRPVTFHYKAHGPASRLQFGLVAEEVEKVYPGLVAKRPDGSSETVMYQFLPPMLLNEYQKQQRTIEAQASHIAELERRHRAQEAEMAEVKAALAAIARRLGE